MDRPANASGRAARRPGIANLVAIALACACLLPAITARADEYVVGIMTPRSGQWEPLGRSMRNGIALALEQAEDSGRFRQGVRLSLQDHDDNQPAADLAKSAEQLVRNNDTILMIGPMFSTHAEVMALTANRFAFPLLSPAASEGITAAGPWAFRTSTSPYRLIEAMTRAAINESKARKIAVAYPLDNGGFASQARTVSRVSGQMRRLVVGEIALEADDSSFEETAASLISASADLIFICMDAEPAGVLASRLRRAGLPAKTRLVFSPSAAQPALIDVGREYVEDAWVATDYLPEIAGEQNKAFVSAYQQRYGTAPDRWAGIGHATGLIAAEAIRNAGPTPTRALVREAMERIVKLPVPLGDGTWSQLLRHEPSYGPALFTVRNGTFVPLSYSP